MPTHLEHARAKVSEASHRPLAEILGGLRSARDDFERMSHNKPLFLPELRVASEILSLIQRPRVDISLRVSISALLDGLTEEHYDGTGWRHFCSLVEEWLEASESLVEEWLEASEEER